MSEINEQARKRYNFLAIVQFISSVLVVLKHSVPDNAALSSKAYGFFIYIASTICLDHIALAAFMITSGALAGMTMERGVSALGYIKKRAIRLLVPYFCVNTLLFIPKALLSQFMVSDTELSITAYLKMIITPRTGSSANLWFLPPLFIFCVITPFIFKLSKKHAVIKYVILAASIAILAIPNLTDICAVNDLKKYFFMYALGLLFFDRVLKMENLNIKITLPMAVSSLALAVLTFSMRGNPFLYTLYVMSGAAVIYAIAIIISRKHEKEFYITGKTFAIYVVSFPVQTVIDILFGILKVNPWITVSCMLVAGIAVPLVACLVFDFIRKRTGKRIAFMSVIFGV